MPTLKDLIRELRSLRVHTDEIRMPGQLYDDLLGQGESLADEDDSDEDDE